MYGEVAKDFAVATGTVHPGLIIESSGSGILPVLNANWHHTILILLVSDAVSSGAQSHNSAYTNP